MALCCFASRRLLHDFHVTSLSSNASLDLSNLEYEENSGLILIYAKNTYQPTYVCYAYQVYKVLL